MSKISKEPNGESAFVARHIGPGNDDIEQMLGLIGARDLHTMMNSTIPSELRNLSKFQLTNYPSGLNENEALSRLEIIAAKNDVKRSLIGTGYYGTITPAPIKRLILENPGWYTQYTPYQPEISQGRLEALLNFQSMISDLTNLPVSNASLLDEGTAAAEAMNMAYSISGRNPKKNVFLVSSDCFPQTLNVIKTRASGSGIIIKCFDGKAVPIDNSVFAFFVQYPGASGKVCDYSEVISRAHESNILCIMACDILSLCILKTPGEMNADIAIGSTQRFGVPMAFGGPHAAFLATKDDYKRLIPGRVVGISKDSQGEPALRLALQTREQHIRREKATSNICTAQVLLAIISSMYGVYHGPQGLKQIAMRVHSLTALLFNSLKKKGYELISNDFFDTVEICLDNQKSEEIIEKALASGINLGKTDKGIRISLDEESDEIEVRRVLCFFDCGEVSELNVSQCNLTLRSNEPLRHRAFLSYHSETDFVRYVRSLESKDFSLCDGMIPLGSCTMKLNAASEMYPISWPSFSKLHPFAPASQAKGYLELLSELESMLCDITGFDSVSFQPNAGSQGEYSGLMTIRRYHASRNEEFRNICLIPKSAHGTNPASAAMAGLTVVTINCDQSGNIDFKDLNAKVDKYGNSIAALMITYPSTHGVFEEGVLLISELIHGVGGQVYLDGANMNALVGYIKPSDIGADVCHINLHKTFCIPHGGGGPGMGPIAVKKHLAPYLPGKDTLKEENFSVSSAPYGSAGILPISWMYIAMMGEEGLKKSTEVAILNANYVAKRLEKYFPALYRGQKGFVAHECILDAHSLKKAGIEVDDLAKRLMDYGFHAPTVSWPVAGTLMVEPTESESKSELDRFCDAMELIYKEVLKIESGEFHKDDNPLKCAPHTARTVTANEWNHTYSREEAAYPTQATKERKFWPSVGRVDSVHGDRNFRPVCLD